MRKLIIASAAWLITVPAVAADLPVKAPVVRPPVAFSWTGLYIGGNAGYHWDRDRATTAADPVGWTVAGAAAINAITPGTVRPRGFAGGVQAGYNWQMGTTLVGFEADVDWLDGRATRSVTGFGVINPLDVFTTAARDRLLETPGTSVPVGPIVVTTVRDGTGETPCVLELHIHGVLHLRVERLPRWLFPAINTALSAICTWLATR